VGDGGWLKAGAHISHHNQVSQGGSGSCELEGVMCVEGLVSTAPPARSWLGPALAAGERRHQRDLGPLV
jgi:hypothetical protein